MDTYFQPEHEDISQEMWVQIQSTIQAYRSVSGSVIPVLRECQAIVGYLPIPLLDYIGQELNLPKSDVFGVASFYSLFSLKPKGRHMVKVCKGTACFVKGIKEVINRIQHEYDLDEGETTPDRRYSLEAVRCLGACGLAPVMVVDQDTHGYVTPDKVRDILDRYE